MCSWRPAYLLSRAICPQAKSSVPWPPISSTLIFFWGAGRCPGRHPYYHRAKRAPPGELGCGPRKESDDDLRPPMATAIISLAPVQFLGAISRCPFRRAGPEVIKIMRQQASPESLATFWNPRFPDQISTQLAIAEELTGNIINLEGQELVSEPLGFTDNPPATTCLPCSVDRFNRGGVMPPYKRRSLTSVRVARSTETPRVDCCSR